MTTTKLPVQPVPLDVQLAYDQAMDPAVLSFLLQNPDLVPLLREARGEIDRHFGADSRVLLEVRTDPEKGDSALFARIKTTLPARDALTRLDLLWDAWWLDALPRANGLLHIDLRLV